MPQVCAWSDCQEDAIMSLSGEFGLGGTKARNGFCCFQHLIAWAAKKECLDRGTWEQEQYLESQVQHMLSILRKPTP